MKHQRIETPDILAALMEIMARHAAQIAEIKAQLKADLDHAAEVAEWKTRQAKEATLAEVADLMEAGQ